VRAQLALAARARTCLSDDARVRPDAVRAVGPVEQAGASYAVADRYDLTFAKLLILQ